MIEATLFWRQVLKRANAGSSRAMLGITGGSLPDSPADGNFLVGDGSDWVQESGATARSSLGLGALATLGTVGPSQIDNNAVDETKLKDALVADFSEVVVAAGDSLLFGDASDAGKTKRDTIQGILDLAGGGGITRYEATILPEQMVPYLSTAPTLARTQGANVNTPSYETWAFDQTANESLFFGIRAPANWDLGNLTLEVIWTAASGSGTVAWRAKAGAFSDDDAIANDMAGATGITDTLLATGDVHISPTATFTPENTPAAGDYIIFSLDRNPPSDSLAADALLLAVRLQFTTTG
ncbi:hypothetical protein LCGC14_2996760 [marine sediment metagenome]|uniref:Uncharacterized protein n=1 Tax=marine sediment metagenome TaxID=412755 RepID=A0A0F8XPS6_9ZZZZ